MAEEVKNETPAENTEVAPVENSEAAPPENAENGKAKENEKTDEQNDKETKTEVTPELSNKILKQVEYYFGDNNMRRDKFLIEQTKLDDGWVPMTVMLNFKSLVSLTKDVEVILKALEPSELIEISEDKKKIRRSLEKPLPEYDAEYLKGQEARTVYLKGFPPTATIEDLKNFFESTDSVENIIMRKYTKNKKKHFKGSIFLTFKTLEDTKAFLEKDPIKYQDTELIRLSLNDYNASKEQEKQERLQKKVKNALQGENGKESNRDNDKESANEKNKKKFPNGCVFHIDKVPVGISREKLKEKILEIDGEVDVAYIDFKTGDTAGWIRLCEENSAVEFLKKLKDNKIEMDLDEIVCKLLEGEEEEAYLNKIHENMLNHRQNRQGRGRKGRRNFKRRHSPQSREDNGKRSRAD